MSEPVVATSPSVAAQEHPLWWNRFYATMLPLWERLSGLTTEDLYQQLLEAAIQTVPGVKAGSVMLLKDGRFHFVAAVGYDLPVLQQATFLPEQQWGFCRNNREARVRALTHTEINQQQYEPQQQAILEKAGRLWQLRGVLVAPVRDQGVEIAYLHLDSFCTSRFSQVALELAEAFAYQLGLLVGRQRLQGQICHLAMHDPLTGALNRHGLLEAAAKIGNGESRVMVLLDLENFRLVNQRHGHLVGDVMLKRVVLTLQSHLPPGSLLCRWGGDEFLLILHERSLEAYLEAIVPHMPVGFCAGTTPLQGDWNQILLYADFALRQAKIHGGLQHFERLRPLYERQHRVVKALEGTFKQPATLPEVVRLEYQKIVALSNPRKTLFVESLLRFAGAPPLEVLALAEQHDLLYPLTEQILFAALGEASRKNLTVSVNLSPTQLSHPMLLTTIQDALRQYSLDGSRLIVEVTEAAVVNNQVVERVLQDLHHSGIQIWLDDFGSGHSSLERLIQFPINGIKLSRDFTRSFSHNYARTRKVATGLLQIAEGLNLPVVTEGVETAEEAALLASLGFVYGQGFLYRDTPSSLPKEISHTA